MKQRVYTLAITTQWRDRPVTVRNIQGELGSVKGRVVFGWACWCLQFTITET